MSLVSHALADGFFTNAVPGKPIPLNSTNSSAPGVAPTAAGSNCMGSDESHRYRFLKYLSQQSSGVLKTGSWESVLIFSQFPFSTVRLPA